MYVRVFVIQKAWLSFQRTQFPLLISVRQSQKEIDTKAETRRLKHFPVHKFWTETDRHWRHCTQVLCLVLSSWDSAVPPTRVTALRFPASLQFLPNETARVTEKDATIVNRAAQNFFSPIQSGAYVEHLWTDKKTSPQAPNWSSALVCSPLKTLLEASPGIRTIGDNLKQPTIVPRQYNAPSSFAMDHTSFIKITSSTNTANTLQVRGMQSK